MDWKAIGLKCGLEIHQQLDTGKLFCRCKSDLPKGGPQKTVVRMLRASAGEAGEVDVASRQEMEKGKQFHYQVFPDVSCLVELDEEPIHEIDAAALITCVQIASLLKAGVSSEIQVMRKTVVDGSNTSGFQRTALLARNGSVEVEGSVIGIPTVCIEEEAARIVERTDEADVYDLSRLGIPLIEIATAPDIKTPQQAKVVAEYIGMVLRSTGKVKRGLGTIRQDLNVSIRDGTRIEIKGAQDLRMLPVLVENEALRQKQLIEIKGALEKRAPMPKTLQFIDLSSLFKDVDSRIFKPALERKAIVLGLRLPDFKGVLGMDVGAGKRFGSECAGWAKMRAGVAGIFHADELPASAGDKAKYGVSFEVVRNVRDTLGCADADSFVLVCAPRARARKALDAVLDRIEAAREGVPSEVRKANDDGSTSYLRPMPGAARMYPETDIPIIKVPQVSLDSVELITDKARRLEDAGLSKDLATQLAKSAELSFFEFVLSKYPELEPSFVAKHLLLSPKELRSRLGLRTDALTNDVFEKLFAAVHDKKIPGEAVFEALTSVCKGEPLDVEKYATLSDDELRAALKKILADHPKMPFNGLIGRAMAQLRGKADGKKIVDTLKELHASS